jgi:hypothetical protein
MLDLAPAPLTDAAEVTAFFTDATAETFRAENTRRQAGRDPTRMTMSGLGGCTRANAYAIAGTRASDTPGPDEARAALLGVGAHDWFLPALATVITARTGLPCGVEYPVQLRAGGLIIEGTLDLAFGDVVVDLKTVGEHKLSGVRRRGEPYNEHFLQVFGYALARHQAGRTVRWVVFLYMDRTTGDVHPAVVPFSNEAVLAVVDRATTIRRLAVDPDSAPRDGRGPGKSLACDRCPWLRRCWGPEARPGQTGAQVVAAGDWEGLQYILALYADAAARASEADQDKDFAKLVIEQTRAGIYGGFKISRSKDGERDDVEAMKAILAANGIEIPKKRVRGATRVTAVRA